MTPGPASTAPLPLPPMPQPVDRVPAFVGISTALHLGIAIVAVMWNAWFADDAPLFDPDDVMVVTMAMPKSPDALPHRAERAPRAAAPAPSAPPQPTPPPPDPAELTLRDKQAPPPKPAPPKGPTPEELAAQRNRLMNLLDDPPPDAPIGTEDRSASSPDGVDGAVGSGGAVLGDPEFAAYISRVRSLFLPEFRPLPALKGQGLVSRVFVKTDDQGHVVASRILQTSGNPSWDQAALTAVRSVSSLPLPPERFRDRLAAGYTIEFSDDP